MYELLYCNFQVVYNIVVPTFNDLYLIESPFQFFIIYYVLCMSGPEVHLYCVLYSK